MTISTFPPSSSNDQGSSADGGAAAGGRPSKRWSISVEDRLCQITSTSVEDGDFRVEPPRPELDRARSVINPLPWTWLRQVHGNEVVEVTKPGEHAGVVADGAVTTCSGAPIAVTTADCSPVVLVGSIGVAVLHVGWRGALSGMIEAGARHMQRLGAKPVATVLGPCIGVARYEFGDEDLRTMVDRFGREVEGRTVDDKPALDMAAVVRSACRRASWPIPEPAACTSDAAFFSHRTRADTGRQTTVAWLEERETR